MAHIVNRNNGAKLIRVSCGYTAEGKKVTQSVTWHPDPQKTNKQNQKALEKFAFEFEEKCKGGRTVNRCKFSALADEWFEEYAYKNQKTQTVERTEQLKKRTYAALGHLRIDKITPRIVQQFINNLSQDGVNERTGGKLSSKTIRHYIFFVLSVFEYAIRFEMVDKNPCKNVILPKVDNKEKDIYTDEELKTLLAVLPTAPIKYQAFFNIAIYTGLRKAEILGLEWEDIDFETGIVQIKRNALRSKKRGCYTDSLKTKSSERNVVLPPNVLNIIKRLNNEQISQQFKIGDKWHSTNRLFTAWNGKPMDVNTPYNWYWKFCQKNSIRFLSPHSFRHLFASLLINNGTDVKTVQSCLGHSDAMTTLNIYSHAFEQSTFKAMGTVADAINGNILKVQ